jgi:hypothetical protein
MGYFDLPTDARGRILWGRFLLKSVIVGIASLIVITPIADVAISHSDAFEAARDAIVASPAVLARVGDVRSVKLDLWRGFSLNYRGTWMYLKTRGDKASMTIYVEMFQKNPYGRWLVKRATVDDMPITLN